MTTVWTRAVASRTGRLLIVVGLGIWTPQSTLDAQPRTATPTYAKDVAPILFRNCTSCHRPGGIGPMSLLTFENARDKAADIYDAVNTAYMPPWHADAPHGTFSNDRRLSNEDKETILAWIRANTPQGDAKDLPATPVYPSEWSLGTPDAVFSMATDFEVPASGTIEYQYFEIPTNFTEDKWVRSIEVLPSARQTVHHVIVYARPPAPPQPATPAPAPAAGSGTRRPPVLVFREDQGAPDSPSDARRPQMTGPMIAGLVPGTDVQVFPAGTALRLRAGSVITLQMHYTAHGMAMKDRTKVGLTFASEPPAEEMRATAFLNGSFVLPAGASNVSVPSEVGFNEGVHIWGILPHTHLRGRRWEYRMVYPDGRKEVVLSVPNYDFNWQTYYMFATPLAVPAGAKLEATAWYDNSPSNPANPNPKVDVRWGDQTWEEMQFSAFLFTIDGRKLTPTPPKGPDTR